MSNGARHALGVVAGLLLPPLVAAGLWYGVGDLRLQAAQAFQISWIAIGALVAAGIVLAFLAGSRLSPVASLIGGLAFTALGVLPLLEMTGVRLLPDGLPPAAFQTGFQTLGYSGLQLVFGVMLLIVSMFPSRWRSQIVYEAVEYDSNTAAPYLPHDTTRPMYRE
ncbi:hypothetical protein SAMN05444920_107193 [Nonomuraea solani]|uniref:Uncharacterized protein n=1 Tax=Nonomuraea solani TaxID=1144553 RepID=A0A1H6E0Z8_9ACTN|nr:hypothetical protein [Nonomuraea solani]SEG91091.1 hypothetical protein SAMN05444920_107193 [Nonomuraea solani]